MVVYSIVSQADLNHCHQGLATIAWLKDQETVDQETLQEIRASLIVAALTDQGTHRGIGFLISTSPDPSPVDMTKTLTERTFLIETAQNQAGETKSFYHRDLD